MRKTGHDERIGNNGILRHGLVRVLAKHVLIQTFAVIILCRTVLTAHIFRMNNRVMCARLNKCFIHSGALGTLILAVDNAEITIGNRAFAFWHALTSFGGLFGDKVGDFRHWSVGVSRGTVVLQLVRSGIGFLTVWTDDGFALLVMDPFVHD